MSLQTTDESTRTTFPVEFSDFDTDLSIEQIRERFASDETYRLHTAERDRLISLSPEPGTEERRRLNSIANRIYQFDRERFEDRTDTDRVN